MLLAYAGYPDKRKIRMVKRVRKGYMHKFVTSLNAIYIFKNIFKKKRYQGKNGSGISFKDYLDFFHFLNSLNDVDTAVIFIVLSKKHESLIVDLLVLISVSYLESVSIKLGRDRNP